MSAISGSLNPNPLALHTPPIDELPHTDEESSGKSTFINVLTSQLQEQFKNEKQSRTALYHTFDTYGSHWLLAVPAGIVRVAVSVSLAVANLFMAALYYLGSLSCFSDIDTEADESEQTTLAAPKPTAPELSKTIERKLLSKHKLELFIEDVKSAFAGLGQAVPLIGAAITSVKLAESRQQELLAAIKAPPQVTLVTRQETNQHPASSNPRGALGAEGAEELQI